jgi:hypothetical protein
MPLPTLEASPASEAILPGIQKDDSAPVPVPPDALQSYGEPVVTQGEPWSYYCLYHIYILAIVINSFSSLAVYAFGNNVRFPSSYPETVLIFETYI